MDTVPQCSWTGDRAVGTQDSSSRPPRLCPETSLHTASELSCQSAPLTFLLIPLQSCSHCLRGEPGIPKPRGGSSLDSSRRMDRESCFSQSSRYDVRHHELLSVGGSEVKQMEL